MSDGISVEIVGLRDARGRFAAMADGGMRAIALENAKALAELVQARMQDAAPHGKSPLQGREPFYTSIHAEADETGTGFEIQVSTDQPDIAQFIRQGHGDIYPVNAKALHWVSMEGDVFAMHASPVDPNPWEDYTTEQLQPEVTYFGNRIGVQVTENLAGKL
jgi:hypothetical protein